MRAAFQVQSQAQAEECPVIAAREFPTEHGDVYARDRYQHHGDDSDHRYKRDASEVAKHSRPVTRLLR